MGTIILGGGGDEKVAFDSHKFFYERLKAGKKVLYIPVALNPEKHPWDSCMEWFSSCFKDLGNISINLLTELNGLSGEFLEQFDGIYVGGGNTFALLKLFNESGFSNLVRDYLENDKVFYGGSAGAVIMGKSISTITRLDPNEVGLTDLSGLDFANNYSIWPHYESDQKKLIMKWNEANGSVIGLGEDSAVVIENGELETIGNNIFFLE